MTAVKFGRPSGSRPLSLVRKNNRATRAEHAADAVANRNLRTRHLRRRDAAHLPHALLQRIHAVHAGMHVAETRSEEHTSELQSRENLVCRLLLEKKKNKISQKQR